MLTQKHLTQLLNRGITEEIAVRLGLTSSNDNVAIPYFRAGAQVGCKYRTLEGEKKFYQDEGSAQIFYNWDALRETSEEPIIITEGEMDCMIALQCGYLAVSVPNGAPAKPVENGDKKYDYLKDLPDGRLIILAVDDDEQGRNLLHDLSIRIGQQRCKWLKYPKGCKDLNDAFKMYGQRGVTESINRAQWCKIDGIYTMSELPPAPNEEAFPCPIQGTGEYYKMRGGDLCVITGVPGYGKSTIVLEIAAACTVRNEQKWNVAIASFEMNPQIDLRRALRTYYNSTLEKHQGEEEKEVADKWIDEKFTFIMPSIDDDATLKWVLDKAEATIIRNHCKLIIIDPWNELDHDRPNGMSLTEYTGFAIKQFKKLARKYLVHVIVVAHPAKMLRLKDGSYPIPSLYDISDSAHWYNKPDIGIVIHKNEDKSTLFRVQKCRYINTIGKPGDVTLNYIFERNCFELNKPQVGGFSPD